MKLFYKARTKQGEVRTGNIEAKDKRVALDILEKYGLYVTSLQSIRGGISINLNLSFLNQVSQKDKVMFTRQFGVMLKSAIPPVKALKSQVAQTKNTQFRAKILQMAEGIETGSSLSQVFALHPSVFDPFFVSIVKSGEATGKVADALGYLADHLEKEYNLRQKVRGAMIYPAFIVAVFIGAFFLVTFFIVPKLTQILKDFAGKLPLSTKAMMALSDFVRGGGWIVLLLLIGLLFVAPIILKKLNRTKRFYDAMLLKLPVFGSFFKKVALVQFCENLSVLIKAGLPITQALSITKNIVSNTIYKEIIQEVENRVAKGEKISVVLESHEKNVFPFIIQMISTGEETGRLESVLSDVVSFYQEEIERTAQNLTTLLEPFLILSLGIGIAIMAISIFVPLFKIGMGGETIGQ